MPRFQRSRHIRLAHGWWASHREDFISSGSPKQRERRVLVAIGNPDARRSIIQALHLNGCAVVLAENEQSALQQCAAQQLDLVILDDQLPGTDMVRLCRTVKMAHLPLILLHSGQNAAGKSQALELGADDFLAFPVTEAELADRVENGLRKNRIALAR